jgi:hypothetical protein
VKPTFKFNYTKNKFSHGINKICTGREEVYQGAKRHLLSKWFETYEKFFSPFGQYKFFEETKKWGVCTNKGTWSGVNQFNTHATGQDIIIQFLNQKISNNFISKGIDEIDGKPIKLIEFDPRNDNPTYIKSEIDNYFFWLHYYGDVFFKNLNEITKEDVIFNLLEFVTFSMAKGTFGELAVEYLLKSKFKDKYNVFRNSTSRGDSDDMVKGVDLYTVEVGNPEKKKTFQVKTTTVHGNNTIFTSINTRDYHRKGVNYLALAQMDIKEDENHQSNPTTLIFLPMRPDVITTIKNFNGRDKYVFDRKDIIMEEQISKIFKSKVFFEFFMYCTKQGIEFNMDVLEETKVDIGDKSITVILPSKDEDFNESVIVESWRKIIDEYQEGNAKQESINHLEELIKK